MAFANQAWGGRFSAGPAKDAAEYTDSQHFDRQLYREDIAASQAHCRMLARQGIIPAEDAARIDAGLGQILAEIEAGQFVWQSRHEDVHMNIEARLIELIGEAGKKLHTGRSRNDQVGLTFRLFVAGACERWRSLCQRLCAALGSLAENHVDTIMPGYTHMQPAQPVSLAQHLLAYAGMFRRDCDRIADSLKRTRVSPLGAAALAGSTFALDPWQPAREVGFHGIYANSMDAVSDRDFCLEALFIGSIIAMHLSRLCEEIIIWANPGFGFVSLPDAYATGSSIMPQKKNPDVAELMRGKTGRVYGNLMALLVVMKGLPLAYNRDLQEDKEGFLDTDKTVSSSLAIMADMLGAMQFNPQAMRAACKSGQLNATELADYLASRGVPFREAHHLSGQAVALAEKQGQALEDLSLEQFKQISPLIEPDIYDVLKYETCVRRRETPGGTGPNSVRKQLDELNDWLKATAAR
ncbi:MAG: argininosuccinate lyase [Desulfovibrio sp.]|nr:argininosuccinate lyase [Desulfovibrio sp.]